MKIHVATFFETIYQKTNLLVYFLLPYYILFYYWHLKEILIKLMLNLIMSNLKILSIQAKLIKLI